MVNYDFFKYKLPGGAASDYARTAIEILTDLKTQYPKEFRDCFRCPSEVLTLSGVRAFDTYYDFGADADKTTIQAIKQTLRKHGIILLEHESKILGQSIDNEYSLLNMHALQEIPDVYSGLLGWATPPDNNDTIDDFYLWRLLWDQNVLLGDNSDESKDQLKKWLVLDLGAVHNINFGMLLGYPGEAIVSLLENSDDDRELVKASVKYHDKFDGAHPVYEYARELHDNPKIAAHQKLWSDILDEVYDTLGLVD